MKVLFVQPIKNKSTEDRNNRLLKMLQYTKNEMPLLADLVEIRELPTEDLTLYKLENIVKLLQECNLVCFSSRTDIETCLIKYIVQVFKVPYIQCHFDD